MSNNKKPEGYLTWEELKKKYFDRFVLLESPQLSSKGTLLGGIFRYKNKQQTKCLEKAAELDIKNIGIFYTGGELENINAIFLV